MTAPAHPRPPGARRPAEERWRSRILVVGLRLVFHTILLFSLYLLVAGHNRPGGGFSGGLVAGAAFVLVFVALGGEATGKLVRVAPETLLGVGLGLAAVTALVPVLTGGALLESGKVEVDLPLLGTVTAYSVLAFDAAVYLVVVGVVTLILRRLGGEELPR